MLLNLYLGCTIDQRSIPLGASFSCWFRCICVPPLCFVESLHFLPGMLKDQEPVWIKSLRSYRSWWSERQVVRRCHNSQCREVLEAFLRTSRLRTIFSVAKVSESLKYQLPGQGICMVLYCTTLSLNVWSTDATRLIKVFKMEAIVKSV